jgi:hypothetical protein
MTDWNALAERCEKATGPDEDIDADIFYTLFKDPTKHAKAVLKDIWADYWASPEWTFSTDTTTSLIRREFPECDISSTLSRKGADDGVISNYARAWIVDGPEKAEATAATEALARSAAFCRYMSKKEKENG